MELVNEKSSDYILEMTGNYENIKTKLSEYENKFKEITKILSDELNNRISIFSYSVRIQFFYFFLFFPFVLGYYPSFENSCRRKKD